MMSGAHVDWGRITNAFNGRWRIHGFVRYALVFMLASLPTGGAQTNDTSAALATGGLRFEKNADIVMRSEDLRISQKEVRIVYRFFNKATADKTILIAFPMPDITLQEGGGNVGLPTHDPENIFDFRVAADGRALTPRLRQMALAKGVDQAPRLRKLGISLVPREANFERLPKASSLKLVNLGIVRVGTDGEDRILLSSMEPAWTLRSAYTWTQTFPAGRETVLEQTYQPSVGASLGTVVGIEGWRNSNEVREMLATYCIDDDIVRAMERTSAGKPLGGASYSERRIAYVLKTGANWAGPIGNFHLTIDKGAPDNLVSFCADGVKKTGPTRFEVHHTNFIPTRDLNIVIFVPYKP